MTNTNNTSKGQELHSQSADMNSLNLAKASHTISRFIQGIFDNSQNNPDLLEYLLRDPVHLIKKLDNYQNLEKRCQDLEKRLSQAAQVIATKDTGATAVSGQEHYELGLRYDTLKGDFESVSTHVLEDFFQSNSSFTSSQRKKKIAEIQGRLSQIILIDNFFPKDHTLKSGEVDSVSKQIINLIVSKSQIAESKNRNLIDKLMRRGNENEDKLNELVKNKLQQLLINGLATLTKYSDPKLNYTEIMKAVENWYTEELKANINENPNLKEQLTKLARKGLSFVTDLSNATPPGRLWIEEKDTLFEHNKHEFHQLCKESQVKFTIFPGYYIDSVVFRPALVFTK